MNVHGDCTTHAFVLIYCSHAKSRRVIDSGRNYALGSKKREV